jgi:hypothetical protein
MDVLNTKTPDELYRSLLSEIAKAKNEITCAKGDIAKANSRLSFLLVLINELIDRSGD